MLYYSIVNKKTDEKHIMCINYVMLMVVLVQYVILTGASRKAFNLQYDVTPMH